MGRERSTLSPLVLAGLGVLGFSLTLPTTKIVVRGFDPMLAAMARAVLASVLAAVVLSVGRRARPTRAQLLPFAVVAGGVVLGFPLLTSYAIRLVPASHGAVVIGLLPLVTAGLAVVRVGERPSLRYWLCSAAGLGAVLAYALHEGGGSLHLGDLLLVLAVGVGRAGVPRGRRAHPGHAGMGRDQLGARPVGAGHRGAGRGLGRRVRGPRPDCRPVDRVPLHRGGVDVHRVLRLVRGPRGSRHRSRGSSSSSSRCCPSSGAGRCSARASRSPPRSPPRS